ncbi:MAG TPA: isoaspartyl peptidase/L-asparaginase [Prolixibacteraceae bacterium]|nr:isoaspartyl peptidase/L-asparaginase [Prolixibacteraceae bacterium]
MKQVVLLTLLFLSFNPGNAVAQKPIAIAIHGGAGIIAKSEMAPEKEQLYKQKLNEALDVGYGLLRDGQPATDVVVAVIEILENSPLFNAGKGAVFTSEGKIELDASIMEGKNLNAGAVAGVQDIKNPIKAAREVMENSNHVMLSGKGASEFAQKQGLEMANKKYFFTKSRYKSLKELQKRERQRTEKDNSGTVGCVVLDKNGNLCAGTSTGGMTNKKFGRIGDSPIIGAGTYADNKTCAVSCTGHGEYYIRLAFAKDISALMQYKNLQVGEACRLEIKKLTELGGTGGVIAVDARGKVALEFNTSGMFRGYINAQGERKIAIFKND